MFIEVEGQMVTDSEADRLRDLGASAAGAALFSAELGADKLDEPSEWPWGRSLRLSRRHRLAGGRAGPQGPAAAGGTW